MNGGKGEPSKTGGAKHPFLLCRPTALRFVAARGIYLSHQKGVECKAPLPVVRLPPSLKLWRDKQLRKLACRTGGFVCHVKKYGVQSALLLVPPNSTSFRCGTEGFVCHAKRYGVLLQNCQREYAQLRFLFFECKTRHGRKE